jgi:hypothetical protein
MSLAESSKSSASPRAVEAEVLQLITDPRDAEANCLEFEQRANDLLVRLERTR